MRSLLVQRTAPESDGTVLRVTPESAGWGYVGFEILQLTPGVSAERECAERECCAVAVAGSFTVRSSEHGTWPFGGRSDPWEGPPDAVYLPPEGAFTIEGDGELALCWAPASGGGVAARALPGSAIEVETRGHGSLERYVRPILMGGEEAESLLVCEVVTPAGHWSSYPPHKHDRDALPAESMLEETYYHRMRPDAGFALQRVYTDDRKLDETVAVTDGTCVLVPRGYHTVSAPPGYDLYYLNVMAGPHRTWAIANDPDHEWTLHPE